MEPKELIRYFDTLVKLLGKRKIKVRGRTGCWLVGNDSTVYPTYKGIRLNRYVYEDFYKVKLHNLLACHTCDTPSCICPIHIFAATAQINRIDAINKGRMKEYKIKKEKKPLTFCGDFGNGY